MEQVFLTKEEAINMLDDKEDIHVFTNPRGMLMGSDWSKKQVCDLILSVEHKKGIQLSGGMATKLGHPLAVFTDKWHFIEAKAEALKIFYGED